ncbi:MAG TPA: hypothetical protein VM621_18905 [Luteibacter sp.]|nr:hypothetical protein [Luteibacter sp.]HVI57118.1 hypothetical protein [Luteibacter sp.]
MLEGNAARVFLATGRHVAVHRDFIKLTAELIAERGVPEPVKNLSLDYTN